MLIGAFNAICTPAKHSRVDHHRRRTRGPPSADETIPDRVVKSLKASEDYPNPARQKQGKGYKLRI